MTNIIEPKAISLVKIAELGSFTKAADELCLTQPAISQHIKLLEDEMGVKLIERSHNEIKLTPQGKIAVKYIKRMMSITNTMDQSIKDQAANVTSFTVGITHTVESNMVIEALANYAKQNDGIVFKIISDSTENLYRMLKNYELDFLIIDGKLIDKDLEYSMLGTDCLVLVTSPCHPLAKKTTIKLEDLRNEPMILRLPTSNTINLFKNALKEHDFNIDELNVVMEIDNIATIKDLIRRDIGVSVLAKSACLDELRKGKLAVQTIEGLSMTREINFVYSSKFEHTEIISGVTQKYNEL